MPTEQEIKDSTDEVYEACLPKVKGKLIGTIIVGAAGTDIDWSLCQEVYFNPELYIKPIDEK